MGDRIHLIESFTLSKEDVKQIPLTESTRIVEKDGKKYKCRGAYEIPVWKLDKKNLNERIYSTELAESVIRGAKVTLGLANHPKEEADVTKTFAVERNPHVRESILWVDAYFVGEQGELANEILEAGGEIGLSSSAYGEVGKNGEIIQEGFEIERYADWVSDPSYQVFASKENELSTTNTKKTMESSEGLEENQPTNSNGDNEIMKETVMGDIDTTSKISKIEERNFLRGVKSLFEKAESKTDLREKLSAYKEIEEYCEGIDFAENHVVEAQKQIVAINEQLMELASKAENVDSLMEEKKTSEEEISKLREENDSLRAELEEANRKAETLSTYAEKAYDFLDRLKDRDKKLKEMYQLANAEKNSMVSATEYKELYAYVQEKEEELEEANNKVLQLKKKLREQNRPTQRRIEEFVEKDEEPEQENVEESRANFFEESISKYGEQFGNIDAIEAYIDDLRERYPDVDKIAKHIRKAKTLFEAQKTFFELRDLVDGHASPYERRQEERERVEKRQYKPSNRLLRKEWK